MKWVPLVRNLRPDMRAALGLALAALLWLAPVLPAFAYSRIVSLKPNLTEILFELGLGAQVVGVTQWCRRPEAAQSLPKVADYLKAFPEPILRLKPDLVIGTKENGSEKEIRFLLERGVPVLTLGSAANSSPQEVAALKALGFDVEALGFAGLEQRGECGDALAALRIVFHDDHGEAAGGLLRADGSQRFHHLAGPAERRDGDHGLDRLGVEARRPRGDRDRSVCRRGNHALAVASELLAPIESAFV
ncbi:ABC transporter substrate-binding protein [bacterium]|nr:MAG: ABC transporter substrate-binding protein [bacterium]